MFFCNDTPGCKKLNSGCPKSSTDSEYYALPTPWIQKIKVAASENNRQTYILKTEIDFKTFVSHFAGNLIAHYLELRFIYFSSSQLAPCPEVVTGYVVFKRQTMALLKRAVDRKKTTLCRLTDGERYCIQRCPTESATIRITKETKK
jgi:hypothetical protein